jgi:hypothetical protein
MVLTERHGIVAAWDDYDAEDAKRIAALAHDPAWVKQVGWAQAAQSDALSRPLEPMAACVWPVLAPPSGPPAGGVPSRVREPGGSTKSCLLPQPDFSETSVPVGERAKSGELIDFGRRALADPQYPGRWLVLNERGETDGWSYVDRVSAERGAADPDWADKYRYQSRPAAPAVKLQSEVEAELTASRLAAVSRMVAARKTEKPCGWCYNCCGGNPRGCWQLGEVPAPARMSGGGGQTGSGPRVVPTPDPVPGEPETLCEPSEQDKKDRRLFDAISRGGRRAGRPGVVWEGDRR